jgi:hypothetical protein
MGLWSDPHVPGGLLAAECTLVLGTRLPFAGGSPNEGLDRFRFGRGDFSKPYAGPTGDDGCTGVAEKGNVAHPTKERASFARSPGPRNQGHR